MHIKDKGNGPPLLFSYRALVSVLAMFGCANLYIQRMDLPVAIVCMVNHTALNIAANKSEVEFSDCRGTAGNASQDMEDGEFFWSKDIQGLLLSASSVGYISTQVVGGLLSLRFGGKAVVNGAILLGSLATLLSPPCAYLHPWALVAVRVIIGMCGGLFFPAIFTVFTKWVPPAERTLLIGNATAGTSIGSLVSLFLGGFLCLYGFAGGWPSVFYIYGCLGLIWCLLWTILVTDSPHANRWISKEEALFIENSLEGTMSENKKNIPVPWRKIFTSLPVWAIIIAHFSNNFAVYIFYTLMPTYLREVIGIPITENGILSALPYIGKILVTISVSSAASWFIAKETLSRIAVRKLFNSFGQFSLAILTFIVTFLSCSHRGLSVALIIIGLSCTGAVDTSGYLINVCDIAPQFMSIILGISNTIATIPGILGPIIVSAMTPQRTRLQWNNVFYLACIVCFLGGLFFVFFAKAEVQDWAKPKAEEKEEEEEKDALV